MRFSLLVVILFCSPWIVNSQRLLILDDENSQCTRVRLQDIKDLYLEASTIRNYYDVFAEKPDSIKLGYNKLIDLIAGIGYLPIMQSIENQKIGSSIYYFIEFSKSDTVIEYEFIIRMSISTNPPYKYEQIEFIDIEENENLKGKIDRLIMREFADRYPLPPRPPLPPIHHSSVFPSDTFDCYNFPRSIFFGIDRSDPRPGFGTFYFKKYHEVDLQEIASWVQYQNSLNEIVRLYLSDPTELNTSFLSSFNNLRMTIRGDSIEYLTELGELQNIKELTLMFDTEVDTLILPKYISELKNLTRLQVEVIRNKGVTGIIIPLGVLRLPNLSSIRMASVWKSYVINYKDLVRYYSIFGSIDSRRGRNAVDEYRKK